MLAERRILVLGGGGFVGAHLLTALSSRFGGTAHIVNTSYENLPPDTLALDICDTEAVRALVQHEKPTHIVNLAAIAAPAEARLEPDLAWELHALAPDRLGRMLLAEMPECWFLHVSSGLVYGRSALGLEAIDEAARLDPIDTYAMTKAAGDLALGVLAGDGFKCLRLRPFNHIGPGQSESFVVAAFASQIIRIQRGLQEPKLKVGNLSAVRDFLDVRDVADAYAVLIGCTSKLEPGTIFNIASGTGWNMSALLDQLVDMSGLDITVETDPDRQRPSDLPEIVGNAEALSRKTGWSPRISIERTLTDTLDYFSEKIGDEGRTG